MLLPTNYAQTIWALLLSALLFGLWANTKQADRKWRFELYAYDFAVGGFVMALLLALTVGNVGSASSFTFEDSLYVAGKRNMATALGAGVIYCIGHMMILAGVALAGMSTALPVAAAMTLAVTGLVNGGYAGAGAALAAVGLAGWAQAAAAAAAPTAKGLHPGWKGFILSSVGGLLVSGALPVAESARVGDLGVGSYASAVFLAAGLMAMTPLVNIYFLNLPVEGAPLALKAYLKGTRKQHILGVCGGMIWAGAITAFFAAAGAAYAGALKLPALVAITSYGAVAGGLCGFALWKEQAGAGKARMILVGAMVVLGVGAALLIPR